MRYTTEMKVNKINTMAKQASRTKEVRHGDVVMKYNVKRKVIESLSGHHQLHHVHTLETNQSSIIINTLTETVVGECTKGHFSDQSSQLGPE